MPAKETKAKTTTKKAAPKKTVAKKVTAKKTVAKKAAPKKQVKQEVKKKEVIKKRFDGVVVSDKMDKTVVVRVDRVKIHSKYQKRYTVSKKYKVHDEKNEYSIGDKLSFIECRPMSKDKRWRVIYKA